MKKAIWSTPKTEIQQFTPNAYVAACSFTAQVVCEISQGNYANGTSTDGYYKGAIDGRPHGTACQTTTLKYDAATGTYTGSEDNKTASELSGSPTFNWNAASTGYGSTFTPGYGHVGAYAKWVTTDGNGTGAYTHEGHVSTWSTTNAS